MNQSVRPKIRRLLTLPILLACLSDRAIGLEPIAILTPSDVPPGFGTGFGFSAAISGDYIAVGAPFDSWRNGNSVGAVYVFRRIGPNWVEQVKLTASDGQFLDQLGWSVAMDGGVIVAGAPVWDATYCGARGAGSAYVFVKDNAGTPDDPDDDFWKQDAKLIAPSPPNGIGLGISVAVSGDRIVVGSDCGQSAEVFHHENGLCVHESTLLEPEPSVYHEFGSAVDIDGDRIVVGSHGYNGRRGAVYLFARDEHQWNDVLQLTSPGAHEMDDFGQSVSISGDFVVAGAPNEDLLWPQSSTGAAYVCDLETLELQKLFPSQPELTAYFGRSIAINDGELLVGQKNMATGFLYALSPNGWMEKSGLNGNEYQDTVSASIDGNYGVISTQIYVVRNRASLHDFMNLQNCFNAVASFDACSAHDHDGNGVIDIVDFGETVALLNGP